MADADFLSGPRSPAAGAPPLVPGLARRTISIDAAWPEDGSADTLRIHAVGRDVVLAADGEAWSQEQTLSLVLDGRTRTVERITAEPAHGVDLTPLLGAFIGSGFRRQSLAPVLAAGPVPSLLHSLLDALPGVTFLAGYAFRVDAPPRLPSAETRAIGRQRVGICAGHTADGVVSTWFATHGYTPLPVGPPAPVFEMSPANGWHEAAAARPRSIRRYRRVDVGPLPSPGAAAIVPIDEMFRDAATNKDGDTTVLHEYTVTAQADAGAGVLTAISAEPRVLPYRDCPAAALSAQRVVGVPVDDLRAWVSANLAGETTCTHLNEALRFLGDIAYLLQKVSSPRD